MFLADRGAVHDVVLGVGLLGGTVVRALQRSPSLRRTQSMRTTWGDVDALTGELRSAGAFMGTGTSRVRVFWCAGRGGFGSTDADLARELTSFNTVLQWAERLSQERPVEFHLTSSAGGLHEGQRRVESPVPAATLRPYGRLKLEQERVLSASQSLTTFIYRPSSVYGVPQGKVRLGMIPTLIRNALARRPSTISASPGTLRDYVAGNDVGQFMAAETNAPGLHYLVMGYPMSIFALLAVVERALQRQVAVVYTTTRANDQHITFSPALKPPGWRPNALESQVSLLLSAILKGV
jgi:UDP-glucose 4-epimerase